MSGHWQDAEALENHASAVAGLVVGGLLAAPFAGLIAKRVPRRVLTTAVGVLLLALAAFQGLQLAGFAPVLPQFNADNNVSASGDLVRAQGSGAVGGCARAGAG